MICKVPVSCDVSYRMLTRALLFFVFSLSFSDGKSGPTLPAELSDYTLPSPPPPAVSLEKGDRLAICGDSITEQKQYSVLIETYLTACLPELEITCRQYGWSGERAEGFLKRIDNDVLRFHPTVATTCYGMNDFRYIPFDENVAAGYRSDQTEIAEKFKAAGTRLVIGSPGIIDSVPHWVKNATGTKKDLNLALSKFRNVALEVAEEQKTGFADVFTPMLIADLRAKQAFGEDFQVTGKDGVHPGWAGHAIMAYAFLKGLGVDGDLGTITWDQATGTATARGGHEVLSATDGTLNIKSTRLAFAPGPGPLDKDGSLRAGMVLVPFDATLNRFILKIANHSSKTYDVTWGGETKTYTAEQLHNGINLATEFISNPMVAPFQEIQKAVAAKQSFETDQIKKQVHGKPGKADMEGTFATTEKARQPYVEKLAITIRLLDHTITITPKD